MCTVMCTAEALTEAKKKIQGVIQVRSSGDCIHDSALIQEPVSDIWIRDFRQSDKAWCVLRDNFLSSAEKKNPICAHIANMQVNVKAEKRNKQRNKNV